MLPSNDDLRRMMTPKGIWVCWAYVHFPTGNRVCVWNRDIDHEPLRVDQDLLPVGYVAINYDKLP